jgi:hypothetical protein
VSRIDIRVKAVDIRHEPAQGSLPGVPVRIDQARQHDRIAGVDDFGIVDLEVRSDRGYPRALDQHVASTKIAEMGIEGEDRASPKKRSTCWSD